MKIIDAIKTYQVPGDIGDFDPQDYKVQENASGWEDHHPATYISGIGKIYLGMPRGFNRLGEFTDMKLLIFKDYEQYANYFDPKFNVPCWKYLDEHGNTLIRGLMPRLNRPFICVVIGNCIDKIGGVELKQSDIDDMD